MVEEGSYKKEWKPIKGYENYEVSNDGEVRIVKSGKLKIPQETNTGYYQVLLWVGKKAKGFLLHRLVAEAFIDNPDNLPQVNHKDGNKANNSVNNLEWISVSDNLKHAYKNHLKIASNQKLTLEEVRYIKKNPEALTRRELAERFKVSYWTICNIFQGKCFAEVV